MGHLSWELVTNVIPQGLVLWSQLFTNHSHDLERNKCNLTKVVDFIAGYQLGVIWMHGNCKK